MIVYTKLFTPSFLPLTLHQPQILSLPKFSFSTIRATLLSIAFAANCSAALAESTCYGTISNGRIEGAVQLPSSGPNFTAYSNAGVTLGRTYVHFKVANIVVEAYRELEKASPPTRFVFGETGWKSGGSIKPHRTHQNGLSVDFFVPVRNASGQSVPLPTNITNKYGYAIDFDKQGKFGDYAIDFEAIAEHLYQLHTVATRQNAPIKLVIFDPPYMPKLFATKRGEFLRQHIPFMSGNAWVRHDEHYHVDFEIACRPLSKQ